METQAIAKQKAEMKLHNEIFLSKPRDLLKCTDVELATWIALIKDKRTQNAAG